MIWRFSGRKASNSARSLACKPGATLALDSTDAAARLTQFRLAGKTLSLFGDDPDLQGWRYGAMLSDLSISALQVWRLYRGRADWENRIKELKADFGLDSFVLRDFWASEAALGVSMLSYNLISVFRHAVMRHKVHHTL